MTGLLRSTGARLAAVLGLALLGAAPGSAQAQSNIYPTFGVHNPPGFSNCPWKACVYPRNAGEPTDPLFPPFWSSNWTMYRVFKNYAENPPPYDGKPPAALKEGEDYEVSYGSTYYDSTLAGPMGEGAMMEHYEKRCLPIFPGSNHYTCSFVSIGDRAFFLTYEQDRPQGMPPCCSFSPLNHAPRRDFVKHLPYSSGDSARLNYQVQGYSIWVGNAGGPAQTGASPDQTANQGILFGYAFNAKATAEGDGLTDEPYRYPPGTSPAAGKPAASAGAETEPYRHPQSFYFSGVPYSEKTKLPNAPIVSQNYTNFAQLRPDPAKTWDLVGKMCVGPIPDCQLFNRPAENPVAAAPGAASGAAPGSTPGAAPVPASAAAAPGTWGSIPPKR
ncbi:hypothetical protein [Azospirillum picis]|uniref:Uncharacterized protein n=1 Tax=Azospirillum picis TaxID=488438 RepID=A0ABU0MMS5_9PROT|nr:hypothetical protein [Azospirillum picis]MBP2300806.1 hypothetical protein [Azospirillum picis]MDQ0534775.1 hypothetical protein [Azospirillum picis]